MKITKKVPFLALALVLVVANVSVIKSASAAALTHTSTIEYNMDASGTSEVALVFTTATAGATTVAANFGSWGGTVNATQTATSSTCAAFTGATALPGTLTASGSGSTATVTTTTALAATTSYCVLLNSTTAVTNPVAGVYPVTITVGSDSVIVAIDVISSDQYTVSATVSPTFTMSLPSTTDAFTTNLSSTALTTTTGVTATIATNAPTGWYLWAQDSQAGLYSPSASKTIASVTPGTNASLSTTGTEAYALGVTGVTTSGAATTAYADAAGTTGSGLSTSALNTIATGTVPTSGSGVSIKELADISASTPAANDYKDIITLVGAGSF